PILYRLAGGVCTFRRHHRHGLHRPALRGAHPAAGPRRVGQRAHGCRFQSRREPGPRHVEGGAAPHLAVAHHRLLARPGPGHRRIRLHRVHLRQPAVQDRDHLAAHHHQAGGVRLPRRRGDRSGDAGGVLPALVRHQPAATPRPALAGPEHRAVNAQPFHFNPVRIALLSLVLLFLLLFLAAPLCVVFGEAFAKGFGTYLAALTDPEARSAIWLTLMTASAVIPLNLVFGVAAAWCIAKFSFPGKPLLVSLIDLPFAISPVIAGLVFVLVFGRNGWLGPWLSDRDWHVIFAWPGIVLA